MVDLIPHPSDENQFQPTNQPTCGSTVPAYIRRISIRLAPQLGPPRQLSALIVFIALRLTSSVCCFHCSLASMVNPRYLHVTSGRISPHSVWIGVCVLMRLRDLVKWVSWSLFGAKTDACVLAHRCAFSRILPSVSHVCSVVLPHARMPTSSM